MLLSRKKQSGNALKGVMALLLAMAIIVSSPLWFNILVSSNESQSKVACMNLEIAKKNHAAYAKSVNECMADNKAVENQAYFLNECRRFAQKNIRFPKTIFPHCRFLVWAIPALTRKPVPTDAANKRVAKLP